MGEGELGETPQQAIQLPSDSETQGPKITDGKPDENGGAPGKPDENGGAPDDDHTGNKDLNPLEGKKEVDDGGAERQTDQEDRKAIMEVSDSQNLAELMKIAPEASRVMLEMVAKGPNNPEIYESIAKARRQELLKKPLDQLTDDERKNLSFTYDLEIAGLQMRHALLEKEMSSEKNSRRQQFYQQEIEKIKIQIQSLREQRTANCQLNTGEIPNQVDAFCQMFGQQNLEGVRDFFKQAASNKEQRQKLVEYVEKNFGDESAKIVESYFSRIGRQETRHKIAIGVGAGILIFGLMILFSTRKKGSEGMM